MMLEWQGSGNNQATFDWHVLKLIIIQKHNRIDDEEEKFEKSWDKNNNNNN